MHCNPLQLMRELAVMQERMNRAWAGVQDRGAEDAATHAWTPTVDIYRTDTNDIVLKADVPGLRREDIDVSVENRTLTIRGQRRRDDGVADQAYHRVERQYGSFARSFTLPALVDTGGVRADYRDGVLTVRLPLREEARERQIQVAIS